MKTKRTKKAKDDEVLSIGILVLSVSLIILSLYLLTRVKSKEVHKGQVSDYNSLPSQDSKEISFVNEELGYSVTYPTNLEPRTILSERYKSFIIFFIPEGVNGNGFGISVRENGIDEEIGLIRKELGEGEIAKLVSDEEIEKEGSIGRKLEYVPVNEDGGEKKTIIIINNGKYSYTLSSSPEFIDDVFENFNLLP